MYTCRNHCSIVKDMHINLYYIVIKQKEIVLPCMSSNHKRWWRNVVSGSHNCHSFGFWSLRNLISLNIGTNSSWEIKNINSLRMEYIRNKIQIIENIEIVRLSLTILEPTTHFIHVKSIIHTYIYYFSRSSKNEIGR